MRRLVIFLIGISLIGLIRYSPMARWAEHPAKMMGVRHHQRMGGMMRQGPRLGGITLQDSTGENELKIPPILESDREEGSDVYYTIEAQEGITEIFSGIETATLGYNGDFLGPVIKLKEGQRAHMTLKNHLAEETTVHWHGLIVGGDADGGPHDVIRPGESKDIQFEVRQEAATLWFHPHPLGRTAQQVYHGLAGLLYIEDDQEELDFIYGENDIPLIIQDRVFDSEYQLNYRNAYFPDGTTGTTLLINGTVNPRLSVKQEKVRLRLLNGSNARSMTFELSNGQSFQQIASDGGMLNQPIETTKLELTPSERAEIIVDFTDVEADERLALMTDKGEVLLPFHLKGEPTLVSTPLNDTETFNHIELTETEQQQAVTKEIVLSGRGHHVAINGRQFDKNRIDFTQQKGEMEVWEIYNQPDPMGGSIHPFHIHGTQFKVISINDETPPEHLQGYKDTLSLNPGDRAKIAVTFEEAGIYMYHCHILEHEDNGMMGQVEVN